VAQEKPFLVLLLTIVMISVGVLDVVTSIPFLLEATEEVRTMMMVSAVLGIGFIVAGYGLYRGLATGWILALVFTVLNIFVNVYYGSYPALFVDALIIALLAVTARRYGILGKRVARPVTRPATPVPPPSAPIAAAFTIPKNGKRFVRRKHRY